MQSAELYALAHPFWAWLAVGAFLLVLELSSGSGYLLWPAASAGAVAILALAGLQSAIGQIVVFAGLTIASTYIGRRFLRPAAALPGPDLNDKAARLMGREGEVVAAFHQGRGRVFVDGAEWAADAEDATDLHKGVRVRIVEILSGGRLKVRSA